MQEPGVTQVEQIVEDQIPAQRRRQELAGRPRVVHRVIQERKVRNLGWIRLCRIAHPDPYDGVLFEQRIALNAGVPGYAPVAVRISDALAGVTECQPMIRTRDGIPVEPAAFEWCESVRTNPTDRC